MGKKPLLGMVGFLWVGLTLSGCETCCTGARTGRRFQPTPLVQSKPAPKPTPALAAGGFQSTPKNLSPTPLTATEPTKPDTTVNAADPAPTVPLTASKPPANPIQQINATVPVTDSTPGVLPEFPRTLRSTYESRGTNTTQKPAPSEPSLPPAPTPPPAPFPIQSATTLPTASSAPLAPPLPGSLPMLGNSAIPGNSPTDLLNGLPPAKALPASSDPVK